MSLPDVVSREERLLASPLNGAPGAVILYALLAVLLWPADRDPAGAVTLLVVAAGPCLPALAAKAAVVLAFVLTVVIWLAEGLGGLFTGGGTDPNSVTPASAAAQLPAKAASSRQPRLRTNVASREKCPDSREKCFDDAIYLDRV
jgi:hypothetical protein